MAIMIRSTIIYLIIIAVSLLTPARAGTEVTNEQLRDGLLSLVHSYSLLENKLDRHEQRERALGDVVKRGLQTLQKGQKIFEPMRGTFSRLDERIGEIETELMAQDKKNMEQQEKITKALDTILKWLVDNTDQSRTAATTTTTTATATPVGTFGDDIVALSKKVDDLSENAIGLRKQLTEMQAEREASEASTKLLLEQVEKTMLLKQDTADDVLNKMEEKLTHFYVTSPVSTQATPTRNIEWEENVSTLLQEIKTNTLLQPKTELTTVPPPHLTIGADIDREFLTTLANETLEAIEEMRMEVLTASDKSFAKTGARIKEVSQSLESSLAEILKSVSESESAFESILESNKDLQKDIKGLAKLEKIVLDTGDNVLSVKKGMEFNVHAVTLEVGEVVKSNAKDINTTVQRRFDALNETIVNNQNGALTNLTAKIETEISQVWRQIGIMYQEVSSSKQALNKLQEQTEAYVNGTFTTMDSMEGKVSQITGRMAEVDENLNYLLGRLSLVTHEFNQIKTGLGSALDNIRSSFQIVQSKITDTGPGPHEIPEEEQK